MSEEEFPADAAAELPDEELADDDLEVEVLDDDIELEDDDVDVDLDDEVVIDGAVIDGAVVVEAPAPAAEPAAREGGDEEDEDVLDLDEELHPDDVEAPLDALLQERTASATLEDEEEEIEEEEADSDERGEGPTKIVPRRPGEFLCSSCFLVLPRNQLADEERMLCRDCA
jgi:hypothetical protein